jgi:hypothetical protein
MRSVVEVPKLSSAHTPALVVPEDAHVDIGMAAEAELPKVPDVPGRGLLVAVVGVEVDGERDVVVDPGRVQHILRHERPEVIEVEVAVGCGRDFRRVGPTGEIPAQLEAGSCAAVFVEIEGVDRRRIAVDRHADHAAVGVQERAEVKVVQAGVAVPHADHAGGGSFGVPGGPPLGGPACAVDVVLPEARVLAPPVRFLDAWRAATDLENAVAGYGDIRQGDAPLDVGSDAGDG